jgi:hypothetical protein
MSNGNGNGNGRDLLALLLRDVEDLEASSRLQAKQMGSLSQRMTSLSDTMAEMAKTMGLLGKAISQQSVRSRDHERLHGRLAKTLIAFKETTDNRFDRMESRVRKLERGSVRH